MSRIDFATWKGPVPGCTPNGLIRPTFGVIMHIIGGTMVAADAHFHNPASKVSAHFGIAVGGEVWEWDEVEDRSWAQGNGNSNYWSVETEGSSGALTDQQVNSFATLYRTLESLDHFGFQLANSPGQHGLGWHGMGGAAWGGHPYCPGAARIAQRQLILDIASGQTGDGDMTKDEHDALVRIDADTDVLKDMAASLGRIEELLKSGHGGAAPNYTGTITMKPAT